MKGYQECNLVWQKISGISIFNHCGINYFQFPILPPISPKAWSPITEKYSYTK